MGETVIFNSPTLLVGIVLAIVLLIFEQKTHSSGYIAPIASLILSLGVVFLAFLYGAAWNEIILLVTLFLTVTLLNYHDEGGEL